MLEAIILAGGFGKRLRSVIGDTPKPMAKVYGIPFLEIILSQLVKYNFTRVILSIGYKSEIIKNHFGTQYKSIDIIYSHEEEPLGTGGAIKKSLNLLKSHYAFVFNGDTFLDLDINIANKYWLNNKKPTVVGKYIANTTRYGFLEVQNKKVLKFVEKPKIPLSGFVNCGVYIFSKNDLKKVPFDSFSIEYDYFIDEAKKENLMFFESCGLFIDIGIPEDYELAQSLLKPIAEKLN